MRNLQCIGRGQPWNQKVLELVRGSPLTAFDFRSGLIWMWWFLQRFAAKRIGRYRKWQAKNGGSIDNLRESREHRWAFCPTHRCRWPQRPRRRDGLIRTDRQHHHASHERWQSSPSARPSWSSLPIATIDFNVLISNDFFHDCWSTVAFKDCATDTKRCYLPL